MVSEKRTQIAPQAWDNQQNAVTFRLDDQAYALPIEPVIQIVEMVAITPIPQVNHAVQGVINYHGMAIPAIDMRRHLGLPTAPLGLDMHIIVATVGERTIGLIVDRVDQVLALNDVQLARAADMLPEGLGDVPLFQGVLHTAEGTVLLIDTKQLFSSDTTEALAEAVDALANEPAPAVA